MTILLLVFFIAGSKYAEACFQGIRSIGTVDPMGDIVLKVGSELKINCSLNEDYSGPANSSNIKWRRNDTIVEMDYVTILDNRTAQLRIPETTVEDSGFYSCFADIDSGYTICNNDIRIGYPPASGINISCLSLNWQNLTCTWNLPFNPVYTKWQFYTRLQKYKLECTNYINGNSGCFFDDDSAPPYRPAAKTYYFFLKGENSLGKSKTDYSFIHYNSVLPNPPSNLSAVEVDPRTLYVKWRPPHGMQIFPPALYYRLRYFSPWNESWTSMDVGLNVTNITLTELIPNTNYRIRLMARSGSSVNAPWGSEAFTTKKTPVDVPGGAVNITSSSFKQTKTIDNRKITLYWQTLPTILQNGNNLNYTVDALENGLQRNLSLTNQGSSSVLVSYLDLDKHYTFRIRAVNERGQAKSFSNISVGPVSEVPSLPFYVTVIAFDSGVYELSWEWTPSNNTTGYNFTVLWCEVHNVLPGQHCYNSSILWFFVAHTEKRANLSLSSVANYQFAVAVNVGHYSSGLVWATCIVPYNGVIGKMKSVKVVSVTSSEIVLSWLLECSERTGIMIGFNIYYCLYDNETQSCIDNKTYMHFVKNGHSNGHMLSNLKSYSNYKLMVSAVTRAGEGEQSNPLYIATSEGAPSDSCVLGLNTITNTSAIVTVEPPYEPNGKIRTYQFYLDEKLWKTEHEPLGRNFNLTPLTSYTNYSVKVVACTLGHLCSPVSLPLNFQTDIGIPGPPAIMDVRSVNFTHISIQWEDPREANGPLIGWIVNFTWINGDNKQLMSHNQFFQEDESRMKYLALPIACTEENEINSHGPDYNLTIRAQTVMTDGMISKGSSYSCTGRESEVLPLWLIPILCVIGAIVFPLLYILFRGAQRLSRKLREMKDIKVVVPKGFDTANITYLNGYDEFKSQLGISKANTTTRPLLCSPLDSNSAEFAEFKSSERDPGFSTSSYDELFNVKVNNEKTRRNLSGDSSGCSSCCHESISSSVTNRTHLSDSGAEMEPPSPDAGFADDACKNSARSENGANKKSPSLPKVDENHDANEPNIDYAQVAFVVPNGEVSKRDDDYLVPKAVTALTDYHDNVGYSKIGSSCASLASRRQKALGCDDKKSNDCATFPRSSKLTLTIPSRSDETTAKKPRLPTPPPQFYSCVGAKDCGYIPLDSLKVQSSPSPTSANEKSVRFGSLPSNQDSLRPKTYV